MYNPNHPDWVGFAKKMRNEPTCDAHRLVFADWLQETYPAGRLHEFIQAQVALNAIGLGHWTTLNDDQYLVPINRPDESKHLTLYNQQRNSFRASWRTWSCYCGYSGTGLGGDDCRWDFERGFPTILTMTWEHWLRHHKTLIALGPVGEVVLISPPGSTITYGHTINTLSVEVDGRVASVLIHRSREGYLNRREASWAVVENCLAQLWPEPFVESFRIQLPRTP